MATAKKRTKTAAARTAAKGKKTAKKSATGARKAKSKKASSRAGTKKKSTTKKRSTKKSSTKKSSTKKATTRKKATGTKKTSAARAAKKASATKAAKKTAKKASGSKTVKRATAAKTGKGKRAASRKKRGGADIIHADPSLFGPLTEGERADALRILTEDSRLARMASVGRYRVIAVEPVAVKPPHPLSGCRAARLVVYDYAADRSVDGCIDLDAGKVAYLNISRAQPMLAREEEAAAIAIAMGDDRVKSQLSLGDEPRIAMHYWSRSDTSISFSRRSAAVIFGRSNGSPSLVAVVDLLDNLVCEIVPANQW